MKKDTYHYTNISNIINKLGLTKTKTKGINTYVNCPFCQTKTENKGYMKINTLYNLYICNNCQSSGTSIELYARVNHISTKTAFKKLLEEEPEIDNLPLVKNNLIKDEYYRDLVYSRFLELQELKEIHKRKLKEMNFTDEYIINNKFKSIENGEKQKKKICEQLKNEGFKLEGIPGFWQDKDFKWTYKSHKGIFIPVILNDKIQGLRICLDEKYGKDVQNIWFSSNNEFNGTKACNWSLVLKNEKVNWLNLYNSTNNNTIIIATEIIVAHQLFNNTNKLVVGIPNNIDKDWLWNIIDNMKPKEVFVYFDEYTIIHTSTAAYNNTIKFLEEQGIKTHIRIVAKNSESITEEKSEKQKNVA